jgi:hypothetical protein
VRRAREEELGAIGLIVGARVEEGRALRGVEGVERLEVLALERREQAVCGSVVRRRQPVSVGRYGLGLLRRFAGRVLWRGLGRGRRQLGGLVGRPLCDRHIDAAVDVRVVVAREKIVE